MIKQDNTENIKQVPKLKDLPEEMCVGHYGYYNIFNYNKIVKSGLVQLYMSFFTNNDISDKCSEEDFEEYLEYRLVNDYIVNYFDDNVEYCLKEKDLSIYKNVILKQLNIDYKGQYDNYKVVDKFMDEYLLRIQRIVLK